MRRVSGALFFSSALTLRNSAGITPMMDLNTREQDVSDEQKAGAWEFIKYINTAINNMDVEEALEIAHEEGQQALDGYWESVEE